MEKIAIHCPTQELFDAVCKKLDEMGEKYHIEPRVWSSHESESCITLAPIFGGDSGFGSMGLYASHGYTITPAAEWLAAQQPKNLEGVRVGDRVVWKQKDEELRGEVVDIRANGDYPIFVKFDSGRTETFTSEGRYDTTDAIPALFFGDVAPEIHITYPQRPAPKWEPKRGEPVLVWEDDYAYSPLPRIFSHMKGGMYCIVNDTLGTTPYTHAKPFTLPEAP